MLRSQLYPVCMTILSWGAAAFVAPRPTMLVRTMALRAEEGDSTLGDVDLGEMLDSAKNVFSDSGDAVMDQADGARDVLSSFPPELFAGVAVVALAGLAMAVMGGSSKKPSEETTTAAKLKKEATPVVKPDVSIPYDAAARLAFDDWAAGRENADTSEKAFSAFKELYEATTVADVTAKQMKRNLENFDPSKPRPAPKAVPASKKEAAQDSPANGAEAPFFAETK